MHRVFRRQPDMAINARAFVKPAFEPAGVDPHDKHIRAAGIRVGRDVKVEARVTADVASKEVAIQPHEAIAVDAVELQPQRLARIVRRQSEGAAVPADVVGGETGTAQGLETVVPVCAGAKRQFDGPIMREIERPPPAIVIIGLDERNGFSRMRREDVDPDGLHVGFRVRAGAHSVGGQLGQIGHLRVPAHVGGDIDRIAQAKTPAGIQRDSLPGNRMHGKEKNREHDAERQVASGSEDWMQRTTVARIRTGKGFHLL